MMATPAAMQDSVQGSQAGGDACGLLEAQPEATLIEQGSPASALGFHVLYQAKIPDTGKWVVVLDPPDVPENTIRLTCRPL